MRLSSLEYQHASNFHACSLPFPHKSESSRKWSVVHILYTWFFFKDQPWNLKVKGLKDTFCSRVGNDNFFGEQTTHPPPDVIGIGDWKQQQKDKKKRRKKEEDITVVWASFHILGLFLLLINRFLFLLLTTTANHKVWRVYFVSPCSCTYYVLDPLIFSFSFTLYTYNI